MVTEANIPEILREAGHQVCIFRTDKCPHVLFADDGFRVFISRTSVIGVALIPTKLVNKISN